MPGLIQELVNDASDATKPVSQLLRRMKVAAVRLKLDGLESWVEHELNGYPQDGTALPPYRTQSGTPMGEHRIHGPQPLSIHDSATRASLSSLPIPQSVGSIENLIAQDNAPNGIYWFSYPDFIASQILTYNQGLLLSCGLRLDESRLVDILDAVRDRILTWALRMEEAGVTGEGMSFTQAERTAAHNVTNNFYGDNARQNIGSTDSSTNNVVHGNIFGDLRTRIAQSIESSAQRDAMLQAVDDMEATQNTPSFINAYQRLIGLAADHIGVIQWALPALAAYMGAGGG